MMFKKLLALGSSALLVAALLTTGIGSAALADAPISTPAPTATQTDYKCDASSVLDGTLDMSDGKYTWTVTFQQGIPGRYTPGKAYSSKPGHYTSSDYSNYSGTLIVNAKAKSGYSFDGVSSGAVLNGAATVATWTFTYTIPTCVVAVPASGTLTASATCNSEDGSATVTWTLTNNADRLMWVTWSAHNYVPRDATTRTQAGQSTTFTQHIDAPAAGISVNETVKLAWTGGAAQTGVSAHTTVGSDCVVPVVPPAPATGSLTASATCNADGSATITWTLTNDYSRLMWITWTANDNVPRDATTRTSPHSSMTFTQQVAAPSGGKTIREKIKLAWMGGSALTGVTASVTIPSDCVTPPPPPVCASSDFDPQQMWEVTWGYDFEHRNGGAPLFTMQSNGGLTQLNGNPVPSTMGPTWHWLYVSVGSADRVWTYTFADGTVRTATVTGADCTPTIVWATTPPPPPIVTIASASFIDHTCSALGSMTLTGEHVTWELVNDNATAAGPGGTVITGIPSATWPALLDGASPESDTNTPYYGGVTVTAVADPGYALEAPYSQQFTSHEPTDCDFTTNLPMTNLPSGQGSDLPDAGDGGTTPPTDQGDTTPPADQSGATPAASQGGNALAGNGSSKQSRLASTGTNGDTGWLLIGFILLLIGGATRGFQWRLRRRLR